MKAQSQSPVARVSNPCPAHFGMGWKPMLLICLAVLTFCPSARAAEELLPKYITPQAQKAIKNGLEFLAKQQSPDGNFPNSTDGAEYAVTKHRLGS